jgi:hypothetical protein
MTKVFHRSPDPGEERGALVLCLTQSMERRLFRISGVRAGGGGSFARYTLEDALVKASEMMQMGATNVTVTTPNGDVLDEVEISELIDRANKASRT